MRKTNLDDPKLFVNRELSCLEFNHRVLEQGRRSDVPPLERLKFLSITSRNLDEFFMIRVGGLKQQVAAGLSGRDITGLTPAEQLERISERAHIMVDDQSLAINETLDELNRQGLALIETKDITAKQKDFIFTQFLADILPALTPLAVQEMTPPPLLPGLQLNLAAVLSPVSEQWDDIENKEPDCKIAVAPIPGNLARFIRLPSDGAMQIARLEQVIALHCGHLFPKHRILAISFFRITRDADVSIADDDAADLLNKVEDAVRSRRRSAVVRLEISAGADPRILKWLKEYCDIDGPDIYEVEGIINPGDLMEAGNLPGFEKMRYPDWPPQRPRDLVGSEDLWQAIQERDILLIHPYESFDPVVEMVNLAAEDANVLAIKQTLYRTSGDSPIVRGLARAAENGKQVTVLVELKARFDEAANVNWARRLEDAGCHVIYGIAGLKTHAKALLIVRREPHGIRRYVHVSTGNYNDRTARIYSDFGLMTCEKGFAADTAAFFNMLTGYSQEVGWSRLSIAPTGLRNRNYDLIEREINASTSDRPGIIMAKLNSLQDDGVCKALYRASQAGVKVMLNIRGICCLRPGIKGVSENIRVVSILDRYLEHARVFYFNNGGHDEVYLSSADWMGRNLDGRLEIMFPILQPELRGRLMKILEIYFSDDTMAWKMETGGRYSRIKKPGETIRAQEKLYRMAVEAITVRENAALQLKPLSRPGTKQTETPGL